MDFEYDYEPIPGEYEPDDEVRKETEVEPIPSQFLKVGDGFGVACLDNPNIYIYHDDWHELPLSWSRGDVVLVVDKPTSIPYYGISGETRFTDIKGGEHFEINGKYVDIRRFKSGYSTKCLDF